MAQPGAAVLVPTEKTQKKPPPQPAEVRQPQDELQASARAAELELTYENGDSVDPNQPIRGKLFKGREHVNTYGVTYALLSHMYDDNNQKLDPEKELPDEIFDIEGTAIDKFGEYDPSRYY